MQQLRYCWGSCLNCCSLRTDSTWLIVATKCQCQTTTELSKAFHVVRGVQQTTSNGYIILVMQLMDILMFQLVICLCHERWFVGYDFPQQNLEVICKDILLLCKAVLNIVLNFFLCLGFHMHCISLYDALSLHNYSSSGSLVFACLVGIIKIMH